MAIDSERKRKSIAAISLYALGSTVVADGSFNQADRQTVGHGYYGILVGEGDGEPAATVPCGAFKLTPTYSPGVAPGSIGVVS